MQPSVKPKTNMAKIQIAKTTYHKYNTHNSNHNVCHYYYIINIVFNN